MTIVDSGNAKTIKINPGKTVAQIVESAGIVLNSLDKTDPLGSIIIDQDTTINVIRVREEFTAEESTISFEQQTVKNESLQEGESVLIQAGSNGIQKTTYRVLYENNIESSKSFLSSEITLPPQPEIIMLGVKSPYTSVPISGVIAYISSSNAWVMTGNSGNRRLLASTGDLDGRIFSVSPDREWLLFSRTGSKENNINQLWLINLISPTPQPIPTDIYNVVHFAQWVPGKNRSFSYSTVEPISTAPGWQANNDLYIFSFDNQGNPLDSEKLLETNSGGLYGWWGMNFQWSIDGQKLAYARPDSIGVVNLSTKEFEPLVSLNPYQTSGDWAWVPSINWSNDNLAIFTSILSSDSTSLLQVPSLSVILLPSKDIINLVPNCGLFCAPIPSSIFRNNRYDVAYLSAILPDQSETSRYNLKIMDRDGSNQKKLFPEEGTQGLSPQSLIWSPSFSDDSLLAFISQGNIVLINVFSGTIKNLTGDSSISKMDWK
ncbi:MAG: G5 domain-containing protein [Chloroflexi bacterium]|nr:G5 domain-containing protein [Chloroflexota bacterium]